MIASPSAARSVRLQAAMQKKRLGASLLLVAAIVLGSTAPVAAAGRLDWAYTVEFPINGQPVQQQFLGDTWWELAWQIPMDRSTKKLVYPLDFCRAQNHPLTNGQCLIAVHDPDTVVTRVTCVETPDQGTERALHPDYLGLGANYRCDRRMDDTGASFAPSDSCLHPHVESGGGANFSYLLSDATKGQIPQNAYEHGLTYSCRWFADPGHVSNPRIRFEVQHYEKGTFGGGGEQFALLDPPSSSVGQVLRGATMNKTFTWSNVGWGTIKIDFANITVTSPGTAPDVRISVPRAATSQASWSRNGFHHEPPNEIIGMGGSFPFDAQIIGAVAGSWRSFVIAAPDSTTKIVPKVVLEYHPVATLSPELEPNNGTTTTLFATGSTPVAARNVVLADRGGVEVKLRSVRITGPDAALFSVTNQPVTIGAYAIGTIGVNFAPTATPTPKTYAARLEIESDSIDGRFSTRGVGVIDLVGYFTP